VGSAAKRLPSNGSRAKLRRASGARNVAARRLPPRSDDVRDWRSAAAVTPCISEHGRQFGCRAGRQPAASFSSKLARVRQNTPALAKQLEQGITRIKPSLEVY
jgi:hypothetical protein